MWVMWVGMLASVAYKNTSPSLSHFIGPFRGYHVTEGHETNPSIISRRQRLIEKVQPEKALQGIFAESGATLCTQQVAASTRS